MIELTSEPERLVGRDVLNHCRVTFGGSAGQTIFDERGVRAGEVSRHAKRESDTDFFCLQAHDSTLESSLERLTRRQAVRQSILRDRDLHVLQRSSAASLSR
jgi:hypothetical protein